MNQYLCLCHYLNLGLACRQAISVQLHTIYLVDLSVNPLLANCDYIWVHSYTLERYEKFIVHKKNKKHPRLRRTTLSTHYTTLMVSLVNGILGTTCMALSAPQTTFP